MQELIYQTEDTPLAVTLATCGVPFPQNAQGKPIPFYNIYTPERLKPARLPDGSPRYKNWTLWDAAHDAWKNGIRGTIHYNFLRTELFDRVIEVWRNYGKEIGAAEDMAHMPVTATPEVVAQICCQFATNRKALTESWRRAVPYIAVAGPVRTEQQDGNTVTIGSFRAISLNASPELRGACGF